MALSLCVLGSGSAGNCSLLTVGETASGDDSPRHVLIDAGLSPRQTSLRLGQVGLTLDDVSAILITHPDTDHLHTGMLKAAALRGITVHMHSTHTRLVPPSKWRPPVHTFVRKLRVDAGRGAVLSIDAVMLAHDEHGTVGFVIETPAAYGGMRLGYATDLGKVPARLYENFEALDMLAIESNYDREMQLASRRPAFLKRRIMGGLGHLSNDQSLEAVQRIAECCALRHIALLHLSRECNDPAVIRALYRSTAPDLCDCVTITSQIEPSPVLCANGSTQHNSGAGVSHAHDAQLKLY